MIHVKLNDKQYSFPTSWKDITFQRYVQLVCCEEKLVWKRAAFMLGIDESLFNDMDVSQLIQLLSIIEFMDDTDFVYGIATPYVNESFNIGHDTYGKLEQAKQALSKAGKHPIKAGAEIVNIYTGEDINAMPVIEVIAKCAFFLTALESSLSVTNA